MKNIYGSCCCDSGSSTPTVDTNIYNTDGVVTDAIRTADLDTNTLTFVDGTIQLNNIDMNFQTTSDLQVNNDPGSAGEVLQKNITTNQLEWGPVLANSDINNITIFQTTAGAATSVAPGASGQLIFNSFFDSTAMFSLFSWDIVNLRSGFNNLGTFLVTIEININYSSTTNGSYTLSLVSNIADVNGRVFSTVFNTPGFATIETHQFSFIVDARTAPTAWVQAFINNNASSSAAITINNSAPNCKISAIKLREP